MCDWLAEPDVLAAASPLLYPSPLISIVEDDPSLREAMAGLVRSFGYRAASFPSAEAFLIAGEADCSQCIVSDIHMPGLSGIEMALRLARRGCAAPIVMVTAREEPGLHQRARESGALCVLSKPFTAEALMDCIGQALNGAKAG